MPEHLRRPTRIVAAGNLPKQIDEYVGRVNSKTAAVSVAHMRSPAGWVEPGQTPEFDEYTVVLLRGMLRVEHRDGTIDVRGGEAVIARRGEWVATARRNPRVRSTWRCVCRRSLPRRCTAIDRPRGRP